MDKKLLKPKPQGLRKSVYRVAGCNPLRTAVQLAFLLLVLWIGWDFHRFVAFHQTSSVPAVAAPDRPPGVEGFLPISGLMGVKDWIWNGTLNTIHPAAAVLLLVFIALSWLLRKSFCSWICPVGAVSEYLWKLGRMLFGRNLAAPRLLDLPLRSLKYLLVGFFLYAVLWTMDGQAVRAFIASPYNRVADVKMYEFFAHATSFTLKTLVFLGLCSLLVKNFWCRYLCPYGGLLGIFSRVGPTAVHRNETSCIDCGKCAVACPSYLPVDKRRRVGSAECTGCLDCVAVCPVTPALQIRTAGLGQTPSIGLFAAAVVMIFVMGVGIARFTGHWQNSVTAEEYHRRLKELDSPVYGHPGARTVSADSAASR